MMSLLCVVEAIASTSIISRYGSRPSRRSAFASIMLKLPIYLDNNSTTRVDPRVLEAMLPWFSEHYGNAASRHHSFGWKAEEAVETARAQVAALIGADPREIVFTSGATESDNLALKGVADMYRRKGDHIITVQTEHKAVLDVAKRLERDGFRSNACCQSIALVRSTAEQIDAAITPSDAFSSASWPRIMK